MNETPRGGETSPRADPSRPVSRAERREKAAGDALRTFIRDLNASRFGAVAPKAEEVELSIRVRVKPGRDWELTFEPSLGDQLVQQIEDAQAGWNVFQPGRVFCFRCESCDCEHAAPPTPLSVFSGYASNGAAEWAEFAQVLIEARDDRVDRLFGPRPSTLAVVQLGHDLRVKQLGSFGRSSKTYSLLGQVIAGYFLVPGAGTADARLAITFQAVEGRGEGGRLRLRLNCLAAMPGPDTLSDLLAADWQPELRRARRVAEEVLATIEQRVNAAREAQRLDDIKTAMRQVPGILRRLAESVERGSRQGIRRTRHVEQRRQERRPVHKALEDALSAAPEAFYHDEKMETMVVCGGQNRAHVFSPEGRHVTSFVLNPDAVEFRLRTRRWRQATPEEAQELKSRIQASVPPPHSGGGTE